MVDTVTTAQSKGSRIHSPQNTVGVNRVRDTHRPHWKHQFLMPTRNNLRSRVYIWRVTSIWDSLSRSKSLVWSCGKLVLTSDRILRKKSAFTIESHSQPHTETSIRWRQRQRNLIISADNISLVIDYPSARGLDSLEQQWLITSHLIQLTESIRGQALFLLFSVTDMKWMAHKIAGCHRLIDASFEMTWNDCFCISST